jgi:hypothetical protein
MEWMYHIVYNSEPSGVVSFLSKLTKYQSQEAKVVMVTAFAVGQWYTIIYYPINLSEGGNGN